MTTLLHLLSYLGGLAGFLFVTLSLASGLLWLAELIEEHSKYAKVIGMRSIYTIIVIHALLFIFDGLPALHIIFSIFCHVIYLQNFSSSWPYISLTSLRFLASCALVVADHFVWFFHFAALSQEAKKYRGMRYRNTPAGREAPSFMDVAAFFAICVWFVPLYLFLSLSANDNVIPSFDNSAPPSPASGHVNLSTPLSHPAARSVSSRTPASLVKSVLNPLVSLLPRIRTRRRGDGEGIIAPRSPMRPSPLQSPSSGYFPPVNGSSSTTAPYGLDLSRTNSSLGLGRPGGPPPPRRVQSEVYVSGSKFSSSQAGMEANDVDLGIKATGLGAAARKIPSRPASPSINVVSALEKATASAGMGGDDSSKRKAD